MEVATDFPANALTPIYDINADDGTATGQAQTNSADGSYGTCAEPDSGDAVTKRLSWSSSGRYLAFAPCDLGIYIWDNQKKHRSYVSCGADECDTVGFVGDTVLGLSGLSDSNALVVSAEGVVTKTPIKNTLLGSSYETRSAGFTSRGYAYVSKSSLYTLAVDGTTSLTHTFPGPATGASVADSGSQIAVTYTQAGKTWVTTVTADGKVTNPAVSLPPPAAGETQATALLASSVSAQWALILDKTSGAPVTYLYNGKLQPRTTLTYSLLCGSNFSSPSLTSILKGQGGVTIKNQAVSSTGDTLSCAP